MSGVEAAAIPRGRQIRGPSALGGDARRMLVLTWTLAKLEFKLKFFGSVLGYFWQLGRPLMLFGIIYLVFTKAFHISSGIPYYAVMLLMGIVMYTFFSEATGGSVSSVVERENLVRKIEFPRLVIPLSVVLTAYMNLVLNFVSVVIIAFAVGVPVRASWLEVIPLVVLLGLFCSGLAMLLSALFVRFRDMRPIWEVATQLFFYGTPILYPLEKIPAGARRWVMCNPLAVVTQQLRHAVTDPGAPSAAVAVGGWGRMAIPLGIVAGLLGLGFWVFNREAPRIAEEL
jgi:ABC-2 type transport system permease protein